MKSQSISVQIAVGAALAVLTCGISNSRATPVTPLQNAGEPSGQPSPFQPISWEHEKVEKLQHVYHLLKHTDGDYAGHKEEAIKSVKKAAEVLGVEFEGKDHPEESQWKSDRHLREARRLLKELVFEGKGVEQPHIHRAIKEIDKALVDK